MNVRLEYSQTLALMFFMKSTAIVILTLGTILQSFGQTGQNDNSELEEFYKLIKSRPIYSSLHETLKQDSIGPVVFRDVDYQIRLADKGLNLEENLVVLKNPHSDSDFPLSFSVIYKDRIVSQTGASLQHVGLHMRDLCHTIYN